MELLQKHQKQSLTKCQRGDLVGYGGESGDSGVYIASVGSPFGRCINVVRTRAALGTSRQDVSRSRPDDWAPSRLDSKKVPSGPLIRPDAPH
jgi:hypothetical protein